MRIRYTVSFLLIVLISICFSTDAHARQEDLEADEIGYWVSRLDSIDSVYDPVISKIAEYGEQAIPFLIERLRTLGKLHPLYSSNVPLNIAWVFKHMKSEKAIVPLLELYLQQEEYKNRFFTPISMILNERKDLCDGFPDEGIDEDRRIVFQSLLSWVVDNEFPDGAEHLKAKQDALMKSEIPFSADFPGPGQEEFRRVDQESVTVLAEELTPEYKFSLFDKSVYILNKEQMEKSADLYGDFLYFVFHDVLFYTIKSEVSPTSPKIDIEKIAFVSYTLGWQQCSKARQKIALDWQQSVETRQKIHYLSGGGAFTVWIKKNGKWRYVTTLNEWQS